MSRSWRDRLLIALAPGGAWLQRRRGLWPRRAAEPEWVDADSPAPQREPWRPAVSALADALTRAPWQGADLAVLLSEHLVRYQLLPYQPGLSSDAEREAYARHHFRTVYGEVAEQWEIRASDEPPGRDAVSCAVDRGLLAALEETAARARVRLLSAQPHFVAVFNATRGRYRGGSAGLVVSEPGRVSLGLLREHRWVSLASRPLADASELPALLDREAFRVDPPLPPTRVYVSGMRAAPAQSGAWSVELLPAAPYRWGAVG